MCDAPSHDCAREWLLRAETPPAKLAIASPRGLGARSLVVFYGGVAASPAVAAATSSRSRSCARGRATPQTTTALSGSIPSRSSHGRCFQCSSCSPKITMYLSIARALRHPVRIDTVSDCPCINRFRWETIKIRLALNLASTADASANIHRGLGRWISMWPFTCFSTQMSP